MSRLAQLQAELARRITAPEGVGAPAELDSWLCGARGVDARERLDVYANAWFARIHDVLADDFGVLRATLGEAYFHDLVRLYLIAHPPRHFSLREVGRDLPAFLASDAADVFRRWPFAPDLAALEQALGDAFDAADAPALERGRLAAVPAERWGELRFTLAPAAHALELDWPVHELRRAWNAGEPLPEIAPTPTCVLVYRCEERVFQRALDAGERAALAAVRAGEPFEAVCAALAESDADAAGEAAVRAVRVLERWLADGLLADFVGPDQNASYSSSPSGESNSSNT